MRIFWFGIFLTTIVNISCASQTAHLEKSDLVGVDESAYSKIATHSLSKKVPLGGIFEEGVAILKDKDAAAEAANVYKNSGLTLLVTQDTLIPPGVKTPSGAKQLLENKGIKFVTIPATTDVVPNDAMTYHLLTRKFASEFNQKMLNLGNLENK